MGIITNSEINNNKKTSNSQNNYLPDLLNIQQAQTLKLPKSGIALFNLVCNLIESGGFCRARLTSLSWMLSEKTGKTLKARRMKALSTLLEDSGLVTRTQRHKRDPYTYELTNLGKTYRALLRKRIPKPKSAPQISKKCTSLTMRDLNYENTKPREQLKQSTNTREGFGIWMQERLSREEPSVSKLAKQQMLEALHSRRIINKIAYLDKIIFRLKGEQKEDTMAKQTWEERAANARAAAKRQRQAIAYAAKMLKDENLKFPTPVEFPDPVRLYDEVSKYSRRENAFIAEFMDNPEVEKLDNFTNKIDWKARAYADN